MLRTLALLFACAFWLANDGHAEELSSSIKTNIKLLTTQPGQVDDFIQHEIDFSVIVTPPYHCKVLKVWLPIPQDDAAQHIAPQDIRAQKVFEVTACLPDGWREAQAQRLEVGVVRGDCRGGDGCDDRQEQDDRGEKRDRIADE